MEVYGVVYTIIDGTNDMEYVGKTTRSVKKRFNQHMKSPYRIGKAIRAHGAENFVIAILKVCYSKAELDFWEKHLIKSRNTLSPCGYNLTEGGAGGGIPCAETLAKLSAVHTGKKKSPEHVAKVALALKGRKQTPEFVAKHAVAIRKPSIYRTLQSEIEKRKLTYAGIGRMLGLTYSVISDKMRDRKNFKPAQKIAIKNLLGVEMSVEELFKQFDD